MFEEFEVTRATNLNEKGELINEEMVGKVFCSHMDTIEQSSPNGETLFKGPYFRLGVRWAHDARITYEDPSDLECLEEVEV